MNAGNITCFGCGGKGHLERDCPWRAATGADGKPPWCGICDERTRLIGIPGGRIARCQECHPLRRQSLKQHRKCPRCHATIHEWDTAPCGHHSGPGMPDQRPSHEHIRDILTAATQAST